MALDATEVRVALDGRIYFEAETTTPFTDPTGLTVPTTAIDLGYATTDGVSFQFGTEVEDIDGWQSMEPLRRLKVAAPKSASFTLRQLSRKTWLSTMGGVVTEVGAATPKVYHWEAIKGQIPTGRLLMLAHDGPDITYMFGFRRAQNTAEVEFSLVRNDAINLPNEWSAVATKDGGESFFLRTNDPAWATV